MTPININALRVEAEALIDADPVLASRLCEVVALLEDAREKEQKAAALLAATRTATTQPADSGGRMSSVQHN